MNTKQIECILEVSKTLNFNRAAENLFISQPALSYQINSAEEEIGFKIFHRSGKNISLTLAGKDFCTSLKKIQKNLYQAIEQGQNLNRRYSDNISIGLPNRSAIYFLPNAIQDYADKYPDIAISPVFQYENRLDSFLSRECDIYFSYDNDIKNVPNIVPYPLFKSKVYVVVKKDDVLARKKRIDTADIKNRTLIVGGRAPKILKNIQKKLIEHEHIEYINSPDHGTTLLYISTNQGICLAPGFLNDHNDEFAWIPFESDEYFECLLCTQEYEKRKNVQNFIKLIQSYYANTQEKL